MISRCLTAISPYNAVEMKRGGKLYANLSEYLTAYPT